MTAIEDIRLEWKPGYPEVDPRSGRLTGNYLFPVYLERKAHDGEWEIVDRSRLLTDPVDAYVTTAPWRRKEHALLERNGFRTTNVYSLGRPKP